MFTDITIHIGPKRGWNRVVSFLRKSFGVQEDAVERGVARPDSVVSMLLCRLSRGYFLSGQGKKMLHSHPRVAEALAEAQATELFFKRRAGEKEQDLGWLK